MAYPVSAVTFDAYHTLFDFRSNALAQIERMFPDFPVVQRRKIWDAMDVVVGRQFVAFHGKTRADFPKFVTLSEIHRACFVDVADRFHLGMDIDVAVDQWNQYVASVPVFDDAPPAAEWAHGNFAVGIVSDIDTWMLDECLRLSPLDFEYVVTSEEDLSYKAMNDCTMFQRMARKLGVDPRGIVHVGDSPADVTGVKRAGGRAVWLNRGGINFPGHDQLPDAVIETLADLPRAVESLMDA
jgi:2-haloacid dehalogenase